MAIANAIGTLSAKSTSMTTAGIQVVMSRPDAALAVTPEELEVPGQHERKTQRHRSIDDGVGKSQHRRGIGQASCEKMTPR